MTFLELINSAVSNATRGLPDGSPVEDAADIAETLFPEVSQAVCEAVATDQYRRSLLRRSKSLTLAAGAATLTDDVLTHYIADATLIDPAVLSKHYAWRDYPDFIRPRGVSGKRLGIFSLLGTTIQVVEPNANFTVPLTATGARTLTVPCVVVKPALFSDDVDAPDEVISDLMEALSDTLRGTLAKAAGEAA